MVLSHELTHIRNHDALVKLLGTAAILLHWYNPLTYFLYWEICRTCEHVCDEMAVAGRNPQEKEDYQMLLLKAGSEDKSHSLLTNTLSSEFKLLKERIIVMEKKTTSSKKINIASVALIVLLFVYIPLPVLAYTPLPIFEDMVMDSEIDNDTVLIYSPIPWDSLPDFVYNDDPFLSSDTTDDIFIDAEGNSYVLPDVTAQSLSCAHQWKDGIIYKHLSNGAGGCSVYSYNAQICTQCNKHRNEILSNILQYLVCPHGGI